MVLSSPEETLIAAVRFGVVNDSRGSGARAAGAERVTLEEAEAVGLPLRAVTPGSSSRALSLDGACVCRAVAARYELRAGGVCTGSGCGSGHRPLSNGGDSLQRRTLVAPNRSLAGLIRLVDELKTLPL